MSMKINKSMPEVLNYVFKKLSKEADLAFERVMERGFKLAKFVNSIILFALIHGIGGKREFNKKWKQWIQQEVELKKKIIRLKKIVKKNPNKTTKPVSISRRRVLNYALCLLSEKTEKQIEEQCENDVELCIEVLSTVVFVYRNKILDSNAHNKAIQETYDLKDEVMKNIGKFNKLIALANKLEEKLLHRFPKNASPVTKEEDEILKYIFDGLNESEREAFDVDLVNDKYLVHAILGRIKFCLTNGITDAKAFKKARNKKDAL